MCNLKEHRSLNRLLVFIVLLVLSLFSACTFHPFETQKAWIDTPFPNSQIRAGDVFQLTAHVFAENGVAEVGVFLNNEPISRGEPANKGAEFSVFKQSMIIEQPGIHDISIIVYDNHGNASRPAYVQVEIIAEKDEEIEPTTPPPAETEHEPIADMVIDFWADVYTLQSGECTDIHWLASLADSVKLQGKSVNNSGSQNVCPTQTTTYYLQVKSSDEIMERSVTITVQIPEPQDIDPPEITNISHTPQEIWNYSTCGPDTFTIQAEISDPSGIKSVKAHIRVVKDGSPGSWITTSMSASGDTYQAQISPDLLKNSMEKYRGSVEYYLSAEDDAGNTAQSGTRSIPVNDCLI